MSSLTAFALASGVNAQDLSSLGNPSMGTNSSSQQEAKTYGIANGGFVAAPIPIKNPTLGTGLALGGGYLFSMDEGSADSYFGLGGFKTDNGSYGYGFSGDISWGQNRWNLGMTVGEIELFYDYFLDGSNGPRIPLRQDGKLVNLSLKYGITQSALIGLKGAYIESNLGLNAPDVLPPVFDRAVNLRIYKFGPTFELDYRDDTTYPTSGSHLSFDSNYNQVDTGFGTDTYVKTVAKFDSFSRVNDRMVVAARGTACSTSEETPFFDQCGLGSVDSFRGFAFGEVLDTSLLSLQAELRGTFNDRLGYVVFAGIGNVGSDFGDFTSQNIRSAGGAGLRIRLSKKFPMDFSLDAARSDVGTNTYYIYIGQRF